MKNLPALERPSRPPIPGRLRGRQVHLEELRILNPLRIETVCVCATGEGIRDAVPQLGGSMPWVKFDLLNPAQLSRKISSEPFVLMVDDTASHFFAPERFRENHPVKDQTAIILLSSIPFIGCAPPHETALRYPFTAKADLVFYIDGKELLPSSVIPAAIRCAEDKLNIEAYSPQKRFIFLVVDDETRWFSQFLPVLYRIIGQRADIMTARTYEEAEAAVRRYGDDVVCLISDINIPRDNVIGPHGKDLVLFAKNQYPRFPIIVASKSDEAEALKAHGCFIMPKGDQGAISELERYVRDFTGLGDFLFYRDGSFIARVSNLVELRNEVARLPVEVLELYAERDYFSTWLYMHGFLKLGDELRPRHDHGETLRGTLLESIDKALERLAKASFCFVDENGTVVAKADNISELAKIIKTVDTGILELYSHIDGFSTWLMRKGHSRLADELRPLHGSGEDLRRKILEAIEKEIAR